MILEKECEDIILFKIDTNNGAGVNLTFHENYKTLMRETEEGMKKWKEKKKQYALNVHVKAIYGSNIRFVKNIPEILLRKRKGKHETTCKKIKENK